MTAPNSDLARRAELLRDTLALLFPLKVAELKRFPLDLLPKVARAALATLQAAGADVIFGGPGAGRAAAALATGLACCAFCPGGVRFLGVRWTATHPEGQAADHYAQCGTDGQNRWPWDDDALAAGDGR